MYGCTETQTELESQSFIKTIKETYDTLGTTRGKSKKETPVPGT